MGKVKFFDQNQNMKIDLVRLVVGTKVLLVSSFTIIPSTSIQKPSSASLRMAGDDSTANTGRIDHIYDGEDGTANTGRIDHIYDGEDSTANTGRIDHIYDGEDGTANTGR